MIMEIPSIFLSTCFISFIYIISKMVSIKSVTSLDTFRYLDGSVGQIEFKICAKIVNYWTSIVHIRVTVSHCLSEIYYRRFQKSLPKNFSIM